MNSILTGSQVYGRPGPKSDVDLVVLLSPADIEKLRALADPGSDAKPGNSDGGPQTIDGLSASLKFGRLNLICVADPLAFEVWRRGTRSLLIESERTSAPVPRELAVAFFDMLRDWAGLHEPVPSVADARNKMKGKADGDWDV